MIGIVILNSDSQKSNMYGVEGKENVIMKKRLEVLLCNIVCMVYLGGGRQVRSRRLSHAANSTSINLWSSGHPTQGSPSILIPLLLKPFPYFKNLFEGSL